MREVKINQYITLKFENEKIKVFILEKDFDLNRYLHLSEIPLQEAYLKSISELEMYESMDANVERKGRYLEPTKKLYENNNPEEKFSNICYILQMWSDNNYTPNLLQRRILFPLLKTLTEAGDAIAKKAFKEELIIRFSSSHSSVLEYLIKEKYLSYFNVEELEILFSEVVYLKSLRFLDLRGNNLEIFPNSLVNLDKLRELNLGYNNLVSLPKSIGSLISLQVLKIESNKLHTLPDSIGNLSELKILNLECNYLNSLPNSIGDLKSLEELNLYGNNLINLPESIVDLESLEQLIIDQNPLIKKQDMGLKTILDKLKRNGVSVITEIPQHIIDY